MNHGQEIGGSVEIVDSMSVVEFDVDEECFRASYDAGRDPASLAVVAVVATVDSSDPRELPPLHSAVDTGALDDLFANPHGGPQRTGRISFRYEGYEVTVFSEGRIELTPLERPDAG